MTRLRSTARRAAKLIISMAVQAVRSLWEWMNRLAGLESCPQGVILYYHAIPSAQRQLFAKQMDTLMRLTRPLRLDTDMPLAAGMRYSAVTFDDGFQSVATNALPELEKRNIPATLFVTTGAMGREPQWWPSSATYERQEKILSAEELQQLRQDLISIGSHTVTHPRLPALSELEARQELSVSRMTLEALLKRRITLFSFPFGDFTHAVLEWCQQAGYERVFTSRPTIAFRNPRQFVNGRVAVDPTDWPLEFKLKVLGAYSWLPYAASLKRWMRQKRCYGLNRHTSGVNPS